MTLKYQNYKHYKIPITMKVTDYGNVIYKNNNITIVRINLKNIAVIDSSEKINKVEFFHNGELRFEYSDELINKTTFERTIYNNKYTFENNVLIKTSITGSF